MAKQLAAIRLDITVIKNTVVQSAAFSISMPLQTKNDLDNLNERISNEDNNFSAQLVSVFYYFYFINQYNHYNIYDYRRII